MSVKVILDTDILSEYFKGYNEQARLRMPRPSPMARRKRRRPSKHTSGKDGTVRNALTLATRPCVQIS